MKKANLLILLLLFAINSPSTSHASFASELLACKWSADEYLLLRASLPRSGPGRYYVESVTRSGKQEIARFKDSRMQLLHSGIGGNAYRSLSSVYFLNDGKRQFLAHSFTSRSERTASGVWFVNLPGYRTDDVSTASCMNCVAENNYCRNLFDKPESRDA